MRAAFGKVNATHNHVLPWTDRPLVTNNLVGGEDGISDAGLSVAKLISNPWVFLEATGQIFRGDSVPTSSRCSVRQAQRRQLRRASARAMTSARTATSTSDSHRTRPQYRRELATARANSRRISTASMRRCAGGRCGDRSIARSSDVRVDLEPPRSAERAAKQQRHVRVRRLPVRAPVVRRRPLRPLVSSRRCIAADTGGSLLLTFWPSEFSQVRGQYGTSATRSGSADDCCSSSVFHRCARGAPVSSLVIGHRSLVVGQAFHARRRESHESKTSRRFSGAVVVCQDGFGAGKLNVITAQRPGGDRPRVAGDRATIEAMARGYRIRTTSSRSRASS